MAAWINRYGRQWAARLDVAHIYAAKVAAQRLGASGVELGADDADRRKIRDQIDTIIAEARQP